jgi:ADP-ribosyl-[dinitrogen reductase] hydrolase
MWCFYKTDNYRDAILKASNLGDDADTTAAITGQIAGAFYGYEGIPAEWRAKIAMHGYIVELSDKLSEKYERFVAEQNRHREQANADRN